MPKRSYGVARKGFTDCRPLAAQGLNEQNRKNSIALTPDTAGTPRGFAPSGCHHRAAPHPFGPTSSRRTR